MSSTATGEASRLTSALTGLSLAAAIAREATDAVPVIKQCLGVTVRIIALAEKVDKDREALHELADRSLQLVRRVKDVMTGRTLDAKIETSLDRVLKALERIETFMTKHSARHRLRRVIGYVFTVPQHVGRLSRELTDAVQELIVIALLDVDYRTHAMHTAIEDNAEFVGEFRLLRHCEVDKLELFREEKNEGAGTTVVVRYHSARVDGKLLVVRYCEWSEAHEAYALPETGDVTFDRMESHDLILKELSTVQRSHVNVARIYGWGKGSIHNRFVVFRSGYRPVESLVHQLPELATIGFRWAFRLLVENSGLIFAVPLTNCQDATLHLRLMGIAWEPANCPYTLDEHLEPTIGLQNDLFRIYPESDATPKLDHQIYRILWPLWSSSPGQDIAAADVLPLVAECHDERLTKLFNTFETFHRENYVIHRAEFSSKKNLNDGTTECLLRLLEEDAFDEGWQFISLIWANILLALDKNHSHRLKQGLRIFYFACGTRSDYLQIHGVSDEVDHILYDYYSLDIPDDQRDGLREALHIPAPSREKAVTYHLIATGRPGAYHASQ